MKKQIIIAAIMAAGIANAQMFAQLFGASGTPIPAVAWYKLDGNALDSSGNGYNGTWSGTEAYSSGGASFSGASYIGVPIPDQTNSWTVVFNTTKGNTSLGYAMGDALFNGAIGWIVVRIDSVSSGKLSMSGSGFNSANITTAPFFGRYANVAVSCSRSGITNTINLIENGIILSSQNHTNIQFGVSSFAIGGAGKYVGGGRYVGIIDDVRIFNRALSPANIQRIMQGQDSQPIEELQ